MYLIIIKSNMPQSSVSLQLSSCKTVYLSEQTMSMDKYDIVFVVNGGYYLYILSCTTNQTSSLSNI